MKYSEFLMGDTTPTVTGIYCITNMLNGKKYIGLSTDIYTRWKAHAKADGHCTAIHAAINKYGLEHFDFSVLEVCSADDLCGREIYNIAFHDSVAPGGYNLTTGGDGVRGKVDSTLELMSQNLKARWQDPTARQVLIDGMNTEEALRRKSEIMIERYSSQDVRDAHSEMLRERWSDAEFKEKMREANLKKWEDEDYRAAHGQRMADVWANADDEYKCKILGALTAWKLDPVKSEAVRKKAKESLNKPEVKKKRAEAISAAIQSSPERMRRRSSVAKEAWDDPELRAIRLESLSAAANKPERNIQRCFSKRRNGYVPTFEEGWEAVLSKGYDESYYDFALRYFQEYQEKLARTVS